jgi:cytidylate kinase
MYFITFSRKTGTGGSEIARTVADRMGYGFYDTAAIDSTGREMGVLGQADYADEKAPSLFARLFSKEPEIYLDRLNSIIYELASRGNAVFLGRGSHILLRDLKCALHVRVTASAEKRLQNLRARGMPEEIAVKLMRRSDQEREAFTKYAYGVDWNDPELYDVVLTMDNLTVDLAVDAIVHIARSEEIKARSVDAMDSLKALALKRRVEAALIEAGFSLNALSLSVPEPGKVLLTGFVYNQSAAGRIREVVESVKGVASIDNRIQTVPIEAVTPPY